MAINSDIDIIQFLENEHDYLVTQGFSPDRIVGIFVYGEQNYGFADQNSNIDTIAIIAPSFSDLCFRTDRVNEPFLYEADGIKSHITTKDIRVVRDDLIAQDFNTLQILYTRFLFLSPKYNDIFLQYLTAHRDFISRFDSSALISKVGQEALDILQDCGPKHMYDGIRMYIFLRDYLEGKSFGEAIRPQGDEWRTLWDLKHFSSPFSRDQAERARVAADLSEKIRQILAHLQKTDLNTYSRTLSQINDGVLEIIKVSCSETFMGMITRREFFKNLNKEEITAYYNIIHEIHGSGFFSVKPLAKKTDITEYTYKQVILKMESYGVAEVRLVKQTGYTITITNPELRTEADYYEGELRVSSKQKNRKS